MKYKLNEKVQIDLKAIKKDGESERKYPSEHYAKTIAPYEGMIAEVEQVYEEVHQTIAGEKIPISCYLIKFEDEHRFVVIDNWLKSLEETCKPE